MKTIVGKRTLTVRVRISPVLLWGVGVVELRTVNYGLTRMGSIPVRPTVRVSHDGGLVCKTNLYEFDSHYSLDIT